jgi:hypothetical protein
MEGVQVDDIDTEDCDRILAEHGLVMWVTPIGWHRIEKWRGAFATLKNDEVYSENHANTFPTKREATEATFLAALEYILKEGK